MKGRELENPTYLDEGYDTDVEEVQSILNANSPRSTDRSANDDVSSVIFIESCVNQVIPSPLSPVNIIPSPNSTSTSAENDPSRIQRAHNRTKKKEMFRNVYKGVKNKYKVGKIRKKSSKLKEQTYHQRADTALCHMLCLTGNSIEDSEEDADSVFSDISAL